MFLKDSKKTLFSKEDLLELNANMIPRHIAIVMDGNRRWAKKKGLPISTGHLRGVENLKKITQAAMELGVECLTAYAFSTENWKRSKSEIQILLKLLKHYLHTQKKQLIREGIRFHVIGDTCQFPLPIQKAINEIQLATQNGTKFNLILALNYGSRNEIVRATQKLVTDVLNHKIQNSDITEDLFSTYLDTANWSDPCLFIRTSGEYRISNFLLWQISYAEIVIVDVCWPDFGPKDFLNAIKEFQTRERRIGV